MTGWVRKSFFIRLWQAEDQAPLDWSLLAALIALACLGVVMVGSASVAIAEKRFGFEMRYALQQLVFLLGSVLIAALIVQRIRLQWWQDNRGVLFLAAMVLVLMTLLLGREINGAKRWLSMGFFNLQPSEFLKLVIIVFVSGFLTKHFHVLHDAEGKRDWQAEKRIQLQAVKWLTLPLLPIALLLLIQPDFGSLILILLLVFSLLVVAGAPLRLVLAVVPLALFVALMIIISPYRNARWTIFMDPWSDPQNLGYQLTHSLMALGRGEWTGVGLGNSIEKLFYLPDAHTDFLFAIYGEEFGLLGVAVLLMTYLFIIWRIFRIGTTAKARGENFAALLCYGVGMLTAMQVFINVSTNLGLLPPKGLTLPLMSYGGSSLMMFVLSFALVLQVDWENRHAQLVVEPFAPLESASVASEVKDR